MHVLKRQTFQKLAEKLFLYFRLAISMSTQFITI